MFDKIDRAITYYNMLSGADNVIVALSGGADSMSLLHFLSKKADYYGITVYAAHLNHMLRGAESERDYNFVKDYCNINNIQLFYRSADISKLSAERGIGLEECGRLERYAFFEELCKQMTNTVAATAHTSSDNAETVLLNITRGCGTDGICGIPPVRGKIIRPLIKCSRTDIEKYCKDNGIVFVTDSTNLQDDYNRNKIRLKVIPILKQINPSFDESVNRLSEIAGMNASYIRKAAEDEYIRCQDSVGLSVLKLRQCRKDIFGDVIKYAVDKNFKISAEKKHIYLIEKIIGDGHGALELRKNMTVRIKKDSLIFEITKDDHSDECTKFVERILKLDNNFIYNGKNFYFSPKFDFTAENNNKINKKLLNQCLSCDIISCNTVIRHRKSGDIFRPPGRGCTKTVKKLFNEMNVPVDKRDKLLVVAKGSVVYWIETIGVSQDALRSENNSGYFCIEVKENVSGY